MIVLAGCGAPTGEEARREAVEAVRTVFTALAGADDEALRRVAPELAEAAPGALAQITAQLSLREHPEIGEPEIRGRRATVPVLLRGSGDAGDATLLVPLRWRRGRWQVDPTLTISQSFDIIRFSD